MLVFVVSRLLLVIPTPIVAGTLISDILPAIVEPRIREVV